VTDDNPAPQNRRKLWLQFMLFEAVLGLFIGLWVSRGDTDIGDYISPVIKVVAGILFWGGFGAGIGYLCDRAG
jgi:hypothetical protein